VSEKKVGLENPDKGDTKSSVTPLNWREQFDVKKLLGT
jgi:hypothetical protein